MSLLWAIVVKTFVILLEDASTAGVERSSLSGVLVLPDVRQRDRASAA